MRRFPTAGDHDARAKSLVPCWHRRRQMHQGRHRAKHSLRVVDQPDQFTQTGSSAQINHPFQPGMMMSIFSNLHELNPTAKLIDDLLVALGLPPLDRNVIFSPGRHNPERDLPAGELVNL